MHVRCKVGESYHDIIRLAKLWTDDDESDLLTILGIVDRVSNKVSCHVSHVGLSRFAYGGSWKIDLLPENVNKSEPPEPIDVASPHKRLELKQRFSHFRMASSLKKDEEDVLITSLIWLCTSNYVFLRGVVTNSPQLIKVRDVNGCHGNQTKFWTLPYMIATESPTFIAFK